MIKLPISLYIFTFLVLSSTVLEAQSEWEHFVVKGESRDIEIFENTAYIANRSGLLVVDLETHEETLIHPGNNSVDIQGFAEIELQKNGHLWLTSSQDLYLYYYDGINFTRHCDSIEYIHNLVYAEDKIWFFDGGILDQANLYSFDGNECINHGDLDIEGATVDHNNNFWYATRDSVKQYDGNSVLQTEELPGNIYLLHDYYIDSEDRQWISYGTFPELFVSDNGNWTNTFTTRIVYKFYELEPGKISALLQNNEYVEFDGLNAELIDLPHTLPSDASIFYIENIESIWINTEPMFHSSRLFRSTPDTIKEFMADDYYLSSTVGDIKQDCDGDLIGTSRRYLNKYINGEWQTIPVDLDSTNCYMGRFIEDSNSCEIFMGPSHPAFVQCSSIWELKGDTIIMSDIPIEYHHYLWRDHEGSIYYTRPGRIHKIDTLGTQMITYVPDAFNISDLHFMESDKLVIVSFQDSLNNSQSLRVLENGVWSKLDLDNIGIEGLDLGYSIHEDLSGNLWINEGGGLIKYDGEDVFYYPLDIDVAQLDRGFILEDKYNSLWIATHENGLIRWTEDTTFVYNTTNSELLSNACGQLEIIEDSLWINHYYGLTKFKINPIISSTMTPLSETINYSIYPNPSSGIITISNPMRQERTIDIFTIGGSHVSRYTSFDEYWSTILEPGMYFIKLGESLSERIEKVVILDH